SWAWTWPPSWSRNTRSPIQVRRQKAEVRPTEPLPAPRLTFGAALSFKAEGRSQKADLLPPPRHLRCHPLSFKAEVRSQKSDLLKGSPPPLPLPVSPPPGR